MKIQLIDKNEEMCNQWKHHFGGCEDILIYNGGIFDLPTQCIVSPANSFGFMDGGIDKVIIDKIGISAQHKLQDRIKETLFGELLVGESVLILTDHPEIRYMISAPTMRIPTRLRESVNPYLASKAIFALLKVYPDIDIVTIPGLGTGVGKMPFNVCAKQMRKAYDEVWLGIKPSINSWVELNLHHALLTD